VNERPLTSGQKISGVIPKMNNENVNEKPLTFGQKLFGVIPMSENENANEQSLTFRPKLENEKVNKPLISSGQKVSDVISKLKNESVNEQPLTFGQKLFGVIPMLEKKSADEEIPAFRQKLSGVSLENENVIERPLSSSKKVSRVISKMKNEEKRLTFGQKLFGVIPMLENENVNARPLTFGQKLFKVIANLEDENMNTHKSFQSQGLHGKLVLATPQNLEKDLKEMLSRNAPNNSSAFKTKERSRADQTKVQPTSQKSICGAPIAQDDKINKLKSENNAENENANEKSITCRPKLENEKVNKPLILSGQKVSDVISKTKNENVNEQPLTFGQKLFGVMPMLEKKSADEEKIPAFRKKLSGVTPKLENENVNERSISSSKKVSHVISKMKNEETRLTFGQKLFGVIPMLENENVNDRPLTFGQKLFGVIANLEDENMNTHKSFQSQGLLGKLILPTPQNVEKDLKEMVSRNAPNNSSVFKTKERPQSEQAKALPTSKEKRKNCTEVICKITSNKRATGDQENCIPQEQTKTPSKVIEVIGDAPNLENVKTNKQKSEELDPLNHLTLDGIKAVISDIDRQLEDPNKDVIVTNKTSK